MMKLRIGKRSRGRENDELIEAYHSFTSLHDEGSKQSMHSLRENGSSYVVFVPRTLKLT